MNNKILGSAAAIVAAAAVVAGCGTTHTVYAPAAAPSATQSAPTSGPESDTAQYTSCPQILAKLGTKPDPSFQPSNASQADAYLTDGTQVDCTMGPPDAFGPPPAQTAYGDNWRVDVFGATSTATVAGILGGQVGGAS